MRNGRPVFFKQKKATDYERVVAWSAGPHTPPVPFAGPIKMSVVFVLKRPIALNAKKYPVGRIWATKRPDVDNLVKNLQDSLKGFWLDDAQVVELHLTKVYAAKIEHPCIEIDLLTLETQV